MAIRWRVAILVSLKADPTALVKTFPKGGPRRPGTGSGDGYGQVAARLTRGMKSRLGRGGKVGVGVGAGAPPE